MLARPLVVELGASVTTLCGIWLGSTTLEGAICYAVSLVFWFWLVALKRMYGLVPLNVAVAVITGVNLSRAVS